MPAPSLIDTLDEADKQLVFRLFEENHFSNYAGIAEQLQAHGIYISKSSLHRAGSKYAERIEMLKRSTEVAVAVKESMGDDSADLGNIVSQLALSQCMDLFLTMQVDPKEVDFPKLVAAVSRLVAANVVVKEFRTKVKERARLVAEATQKTLKKASGLSDEAAEEIIRKILGIAD